jgi:hypothetical protein
MAQWPWRHLDVVYLKANKLRPAQAATKQHGQHGIVAFGTERLSGGLLENFRALLERQPVAGAKAELLNSFDATDSGG